MGDLVALKAEIDHEGELLVLDGFEGAILGYGMRQGMKTPVVVYDRDVIVEIMKDRAGMSEDDADEYFLEHVLHRDFGPGNPLFVSLAPVQEH
tara:strand:- start:14938 stop:15216 length:279 start_codon:yes stop_codon:yes gene_type:complete